jgi:hypothetical protein
LLNQARSDTSKPAQRNVMRELLTWFHWVWKGMLHDNTDCRGRGAAFPKRPALLKLSRESICAPSDFSARD